MASPILFGDKNIAAVRSMRIHQCAQFLFCCARPIQHTIIISCTYTYRLEDFENSCAAYDKAAELSEDYLTFLNYAITLFTNDEIERARKQFAKFEVMFKKQREEGSDIDPEILAQAELMRAALKK